MKKIKKELLKSFEWYSYNIHESYTKVEKDYSLNERMRLGFPISEKEYIISMKHLILSLNKNFKGRTNLNIK